MNSSPTRFSRRGILGLAALATTGTLVAGCAKTSSTPAGTSSGASDATKRSGGMPLDVYDAIIKGGPVADDATIKASPWATKIKQAGVLRRGGSNTGAIFSILDPTTGRITGFDAGIGDLLAHYILGGDDVSKLSTLTVTTVDTRETLLQNGTIDAVVATYSITPARAEKVAFAGPYYASGAGIQVRKDNTAITKVSDLDGKKIATESNSTGLTAIKDHVKNPQITLFADNESCTTALSQKRVDAYVLDQAILLSNVVKDPSLTVVGEPFTEDPYGIGVTKADPTAKKFVNDFLTKIYASGDWAKLWKASVGQYVTGQTPTPPKLGSVTGS